MSYFVTVSGSIAESDMPPGAKLVPAAKAENYYIARLERDLAELDGAPVYFIDDGETGTSEELVLAVGEALRERKAVETLPLVVLLEKCIRNKWNFRIWHATNDTGEHRRVAPAQDLGATLASIAHDRGVFSHAS